MTDFPGLEILDTIAALRQSLREAESRIEEAIAMVEGHESVHITRAKLREAIDLINGREPGDYIG